MREPPMVVNKEEKPIALIVTGLTSPEPRRSVYLTPTTIELIMSGRSYPLRDIQVEPAHMPPSLNDARFDTPVDPYPVTKVGFRVNVPLVFLALLRVAHSLPITGDLEDIYYEMQRMSNREPMDNLGMIYADRHIIVGVERVKWFPRILEMLRPCRHVLLSRVGEEQYQKLITLSHMLINLGTNGLEVRNMPVGGSTDCRIVSGPIDSYPKYEITVDRVDTVSLHFSIVLGAMATGVPHDVV